ncbi:MAG: agmatine deiminase, partial [Spirochaetales bacterium]|nr:agmatine deiminase [Spirochaetales bacterium]
YMKICDSTPKKDGFRMPGEFEPQQQIWMIWPERTDNWRNGAKPAQEAYARVAEAINKFTPVTMLVSNNQYNNCVKKLSKSIRVVEMSSNDAWSRDMGPTFLVNDNGEIRACNWRFNAWGGLGNGLYFPWDKDDMIAQKICNMEQIDYYSTDSFVLEGGSIHVDGQGTVMTTEMCLLDPHRNGHMNKKEIEKKLCDYLNCEKVLWIKDGIDPEETNGHIDDVACFVRPGEVACIYSDDSSHPFYREAQAAYKNLCQATDARGRKIKVHKLCLTKNAVLLQGADSIDCSHDSVPRREGDLCIASYMNFLISNDGVIVPQYDDPNDTMALEQIKAMFPEHQVIGVSTREIVYGGGNIHCITQQQPKV